MVTQTGEEKWNELSQLLNRILNWGDLKNAPTGFILVAWEKAHPEQGINYMGNVEPAEAIELLSQQITRLKERMGGEEEARNDE